MNDFDLEPGALHRGSGVIGRWPGIVLLVPSDPGHDPVVDELFEQLGHEPTPADMVRLVHNLIMDRRVLRSVGYLLNATGGPMAMAYGPVEILVDGQVVVAGGDVPNELHLTTNASRLTIRATNLDGNGEHGGHGGRGPTPPFDLRRGIVPGDGITIGGPVRSDRTGMTAPPRPEHARAAGSGSGPALDGTGGGGGSAEVAAPFRSVTLLGRDQHPSLDSKPLPLAGDELLDDSTSDRPAGSPLPGRGPGPLPGPGGQLPGGPPAPSHRGEPSGGAAVVSPGDTSPDESEMVHGIMCSRNHFNNPDAHFCMICGISMIHLTHNLVPGPRPTLGFVVFDDGSTFGLDRSYLVGREPGEPPDPNTAPLSIQDNNETLSRRHAEIRLVEWEVHVVDLGSTNGTFLWDANFERWNQIAAHSPIALPPGATIALGRRTFVFESVSRN